MKAKKRFLAMMLSILMILSFASFLPQSAFTDGTTMTASAANTAESGKCGENVYWSLSDDGVLTISGKGEMTIYDGEDSPFENRSDIKSVVIKSGVTSIGDCAFMKCISLTSVTIPSSVTYIGPQVFDGCKSLTSVTIPNSVTWIDWQVFYGCSSLISVTIPSSVKSIGDSAFSYCTSLTSVTIPNSVTSIGENAFENCTSLESITIPGSVTKIDYEAFCGCKSLTSVTIQNGVKLIDAEAFIDCSSLTSVTIPDSVIEIGNHAFGFCYDRDYDYDDYEYNPYGITIKCTAGSEAEKYALKNNLDIAYIIPSLNDAKISLEATHKYTGKQICPLPVVVLDGRTLVKDTDYTLSYKDNVKVGTATVTITGIGKTKDSVSKTFKIVDNLDVSLSCSSYTYSGKKNEPAVTVKFNGKTLIKDTDYTFVYKNNIDPGTGSVVVTLKGNYSGTVTKTFKINKVDIGDADVRLSSSSFVYTGEKKLPTPKVVLDGKTLVKDRDYSVSYVDNTKAGTGYVVIKGKGNYCGSNKVSFNIKAASIKSANVKLSRTSYLFSGEAKLPTPTVVLNKKKLVKGRDYKVSYSNNKEAGTAVVTITGIGNYSGKITSNFTINARKLASSFVSLSNTSYIYNGKDKHPSVSVWVNGIKISSRNYTVSYKNNINTGKATVTVTGKNSLNGTVTKTFSISKADVSSARVKLESSSYYYDGKAKTPGVTVTLGGRTLVKGKDYKLSYSSNVKVGTAYVKITGIGNYKGQKSLSFTIRYNIQKAVLSDVKSSYYYTSNRIKPAPVLTYEGKKLTAGKDYTLSYSDNVMPGIATITIKGTGNYKGTVTKRFKINKALMSSAKVQLQANAFYYSGSARKPSVIVANAGIRLTEGRDYTVSYKNNVNVGSASVIITGKGNYTGSITKTFKIVRVPITNASVSLPKKNFYYMGYALNPAVTVNYANNKLVKDKDYTLQYKNNNAIGTATVVITGKGNFTGTISKTFTIKRGFVWGRDNWNFNNSYTYFYADPYLNQINYPYYSVLLNNLPTKYNSDLGSSEFRRAYSAMLEDWGGSCYGMSALELLSVRGLLKYSKFQSGATKLHDFSAPKKNETIESLITYYQILQNKDSVAYEKNKTYYSTNKENLQKIASLLEKNPTVLVCFSQKNFGGHAVLAYYHQTGSWSVNGVRYQKRFKICDPNSSMKDNENYYIYYNADNYRWTIPNYRSSGVDSVYGAKFLLITADVNLVNDGGYLSGTKKYNSSSNSYIARLDSSVVLDNITVEKCTDMNGNDSKDVTDNDIRERTDYTIGGSSKGKDGYDLFDADSAYKVTQRNAGKLDMSIKYADSYLTAVSEKGTQAVFDKNGLVSISGEKAKFSLSMTLDENLTRSWSTISVSGINASEASVKKANNGWIVSADRLENVQVNVSRRLDGTSAYFTTDYSSVLIFEIDERTIGIAADTDNNGTYETVLNTQFNNGISQNSSFNNAISMFHIDTAIHSWITDKRCTNSFAA